jgi:hypothetical protein
VNDFAHKPRILLLLACVAAYVLTAGAPVNPDFTVSTIAGSGLSGVRDGDASSAQFMKPVGIAADAMNDVYVADAAAQRIRFISATGDVRTLAGSGDPQYDNTWVIGGFKDGPALQARFNRPSGVAVAPDGSVYVADTLNHCIRVIKDGNVTTYSGSPGNTAGGDGPIAQASYVRPRALAFDAKGDLFVADISIGIRKISGGMVTTLPLPPTVADKNFLSIAFSGAANDETMFVSTANEIVAFDRNLKVIREQSVSGGGTLYGPRGILNTAAIDQSQGIGPAFGLAAFSDGRLFFADARSHALRAVNDFSQSVTQSIPRLIPDAADFGGGYRDGPLRDALFDAPMGLATLRDGSIVVADMGNRRIRKVSVGTAVPVQGVDTLPPDRPAATDSSAAAIVVAGEDPFPGVSKSYYRIAYLGNSYAYFNTRWADSIPGLIESGLRSNWRTLGFPKPPKVVCVSPFLGLSGFRDYIDNILSLGVVDAVILQLNAANIGASFPPPLSATPDFKAYAHTWTLPTQNSIAAMNTELKNAGIPLVIVINPTAPHVSPLEVPVVSEVNEYQDWLFLTSGPPSGDTFEDAMRQVVARSGIPSIDLFPEFLDAEQSAHRVPLYGTMDAHFSRNGRALAAKAIVRSLVRMRFWQTK